MPNRDLPPEAAQYWGVIRSAAANRMTTAELWGKIRQFEENRGITRPAGMFGYVSQMRSMATQSRMASGRLTAAGPDTVIQAEHIGPELHARPLQQQALNPKYVARFKATVVTATGEATKWLSFIFHNALPATKGALMAFLHLNAPSIGIGSEELVTGITGDVELVAV